MADGSIRIETKIGTKEAEADLNDLVKMCDDTQKHIQSTAADFGLKTNPYEIFNDKALVKAEKRLDEIKKQIEEIQSYTNDMLPQAATDEQAANLVDFEESQTKALIEEQTLLTQAAEAYKQKQTEITAEKQRQKDLQAAERQEKTDVKTVNSDVSQQLAAQDFVSKIKSAEEYNAALDRVSARMQEIEAQTARMAAEKGISADDALRTNKEYQKLKAQMDALTSSTRKFKSTSSDSFGAARKSASQVTDSLKAGIKQLTRYTLAIFGARSAFAFVKSEIRQVLAENEQLNNTVTAMKGVFASALTPVVEKIVYYLQYAMAYLNLFIKTLTGVDMVANYNAKALKKQADATKQAGQAAKETRTQLAGFDEMNVLQSDTSASASVDTSAIEAAAATLELPDVSGGKFEEICETIKANLEELETAAGIALVAVGLILLSCGQIPEGIAAIIAGIGLVAAALGSWDELSAETQNMITAMLAIAGAGMLAIGLILIATGANLPLGIGLLIAGFAGIVTAVGINWGSLTPKIKTVINTLMTVVSAASLVIGAILALTGANLPLGVALIALGASTMIAAIALNWDSMPDNVRTTVLTITSIVSAALIVIGSVIAFSGANLPLGIALMAAGAVGLVASIAVMWNTLPDNVKNTISVITAATSAALLALGIILCATGVALPLGIGLIVAGAAGLVTVATINRDIIKNWVSDTWSGIKDYWNANIKKVFTAQWWMNKLNALPEGAKGAINTAISYIEMGINWMVQQINRISFKIPDFVPKWGGAVVGFNLHTVKMPRLEAGAIVNNPGRGVDVNAGEAGPEAILPLTNHTEWMDVLADKINSGRIGNIIVKVLLDGKEISAKVRTEEQRFTFATNGGVL